MNYLYLLPLLLLFHFTPQIGQATVNCYRISAEGVEYHREYTDPQFGRTSITRHPVPKADPPTFEILAGPAHTCWAKDRNHVYHADRIVPLADPAAFHFLPNNYASDGKDIFYKSKKIPVHFPSFEVFSFPDDLEGVVDAHDRDFLYFKGTPAKSFSAKPDAKTFQPLSRFFFHDKESILRLVRIVQHGRVTYDLLPLPEADPDSFTLLNTQGTAAKDRNKVFCYYQNGRRFQIFSPKDIASFELINSLYAKDQKAGYFMGKEINGVDPASFTSMGRFEARDRYRLYNRKGVPTAISDNLSRVKQ